MYRYYVLILLSLTYAFSFMDRQIVSILMEDISAEFSLNDTQLGLLSGLAFALLYGTLGIPIARLADKYNRMRIVAISLTIWSGVTIFCGMVSNFWQLLLGRVGVGIGEAGGTAPSHSVISDYFHANERSFAISIFSAGTSIGAMAGLVLGGYVAENYGWRMAFVVAGAPGILLALLIHFSAREPVRGTLEKQTAQPQDVTENFRATVTDLWNNKVYRYVNIAHVLGVFAVYAILIWTPSLFLRNFDINKTETGALVGSMILFAGAPGMLFGGFLADRLGKRDFRWQAWLPAIAVLLAFPFALMGFWSDSKIVAITCIGIGYFGYQMSHATGLAVVQSVVVPHQRAQAAAFVFLFSSIIGLGLGPLVVGAISDVTAASFGDRSLSVALTISMFILLAAALFYMLTARAMNDQSGEDKPIKV